MKTKVKMGLAKRTVPELLEYGTHAVNQMSGNAFFNNPPPNPALAVVAAAITALRSASDTARGAGPKQTEDMNKSRESLETLLTALGNYVEGIANNAVNAAAGANAVILSAGMEVKGFSAKQKQVFSADPGSMPGTVNLRASSVNRGAHEWQYAEDTGNPVNWISTDPTTQASTTINGLGIAKRYTFRHRSVTPDGPTDWDDPISLVVV